jgi:hypothetical protein
MDAGKADLAKKVLWCPETWGTGMATDIASFTCVGDAILIGAKTTNGEATRRRARFTSRRPNSECPTKRERVTVCVGFSISQGIHKSSS